MAYLPGRFWGRAVLVLAAAVGVAAGASSASALPVGVTGWRVTAVVPGVSSPVALRAISASGAADGWAAGTRASGGLLLERWNGSAWKQVAAPAGFGAGVTEDLAIGATSATDVWTFPALGSTSYGLHWNGSSWTKFLFGTARITATAVFGPKSVWVFGWKPGATSGTAYAAYYDGSTWKQSPVPAVPADMTALSSADIWGIGQTSKGTGTAMHWNGRAWTALPIPALPAYHGIAWRAYFSVATTSHDLWVLEGLALNQGTGTSPPGATLLHWNGTKWSVAAKNPAWWLYGLTPDGHGGFWLTGEKTQPVGFALYNSYIVHYSGGRWTYQTPPARTGYTSATAGLITPIPGTSSFWALGQLSSASNPFGAASILKYGP